MKMEGPLINLRPPFANGVALTVLKKKVKKESAHLLAGVLACRMCCSNSPEGGWVMNRPVTLVPNYTKYTSVYAMLFIPVQSLRMRESAFQAHLQR
jgi:hypothetical protein